MSAAHITSRVLAQGASPSRNHVSNTERFSNYLEFCIIFFACHLPVTSVTSRPSATKAVK